MGLIYCNSKEASDVNLKVIKNLNYDFKGVLSIKNLSKIVLLSADLVIIADEPLKNRNYFNTNGLNGRLKPDIWHRSSSMNRITEMCRFMGTPIIVCTYDFDTDIGINQKNYGLMIPECKYSITDNTYMSDMKELPDVLKQLNMSSHTHNILIIEGAFSSQKGCNELWDLLA